MKINEVNTNIVQAILTKSLLDHKGRSNAPKRIKFLLNQFYEHLIEQGLAYDNPTLKCKVSNRYKKTYMDSKCQHKNNENYKAIPVAERERFIRALDDGTDISPGLFRVWLQKTLTKVNLPKVTLHSLRHTNITLQLVAGVDMKTVAGRVGHCQTSTTTDIYSHFLQSSDKKVSNILDKIF